jgi:hypothetical protein
MMMASETSTKGLELSFVDFCRMTEDVLVSIDKELVSKGILINQIVHNKMGEMIIMSRKVTNPND